MTKSSKAIVSLAAGTLLSIAPFMPAIAGADGGYGGYEKKGTGTSSDYDVYYKDDYNNNECNDYCDDFSYGGYGGRRDFDFGDLLVLDRLFSGNGLIGSRRTDLGDIIILDKVFNEDGIRGNIGDLFVLDRIFDDGILSGGRRTNLGDILILDQLFF